VGAGGDDEAARVDLAPERRHPVGPHQKTTVAKRLAVVVVVVVAAAKGAAEFTKTPVIKNGPTIRLLNWAGKVAF
jgi:hypothetical protein